MSFNLDNEKATDVLIWWIEGTDGSITKSEEETVDQALEEMNYSLETYHEKTKMHISGLSNEKMEMIVDKSIQWGAEHFGEERKQKTLNLLNTIAHCNDKKQNEQDKIDRIKQAWNI